MGMGFNEAWEHCLTIQIDLLGGSSAGLPNLTLLAHSEDFVVLN